MSIGISWLDVRLSFRMLVKYPGLSLVGGLAIAFAVWVGAAGFEVYRQVLHPTLPLDAGDRVVGVQLLDLASAEPESPTVHDLADWRGALSAIEDLGAFRAVERNLVAAAGSAGPVAGAEITASAFRVARVAPLLGRVLVEADERPDAPAVAVLGHDVWRSRFAADPGIVGRDVRVGTSVYTVVGVMPPGFAFPVAQNLWVPLRLQPHEFERGGGPELRVFGRLAPGATLAEAQAELSALGARAAADFPATHERLRPRVLPYAVSILDVSGDIGHGLVLINAFLVMLLLLVFGNVALLTYARAASRESEIVVRTALGASRGRIVGQLFMEALALGIVAACVGLAGATGALRQVMRVYEAEAGGRLPFWLDASLSPATVLYAGALTLLGAAIAGVVPALKLTRGLHARLQQATAGGGGFRFGGVWTAVIVAQVAATLVFPLTVHLTQREVANFEAADVGFASHEYLAARLEIDRDETAGESDGARAETLSHYRLTLGLLQERLEADPAVVAVTFADELPRSYHRPSQIMIEGAAGAADKVVARHPVATASVATDFFAALDAPVLLGRGFDAADLASGRNVVVVNRSFVDQVLGGRGAIGTRVRYAAHDADEPGPWHEIVGVVPDLGMINEQSRGAGLYHPLTAGGGPMRLAVRVRGEPEAFAGRMHAIAAAVDPALRLQEAMPLDRAGFRSWSEMAFLFRVTLLISAIALLLALAGIYSVMAFTVSQRTREIGIRVALGASAGRVVAAVFRRPLRQVGIGVAAGGALGAILMLVYYGAELSAGQVVQFLGYTVLMFGVCLLSCVVPTRRALGVEPTIAMRTD